MAFSRSSVSFASTRHVFILNIGSPGKITIRVMRASLRSRKVIDVSKDGLLENNRAVVAENLTSRELRST